MVVGVTQDGRRSVVAYGAADTTGRALDENAVFEIGSVTKLFTALLLADMVGVTTRFAQNCTLTGHADHHCLSARFWKRVVKGKSPGFAV
jgi:Beta-lactamase